MTAGAAESAAGRRRGRPRIVCIGGGTGLSVVLRGFRDIGVEPTAIVTLTDDGGSSGRLRRDLEIPPPGDIRNCITALAEDESVLTAVFAHRFERGELAGHSLGNLVLAALTEIQGSFEGAIAAAHTVLNIHGQVLPATAEGAVLVAEMQDGSVVAGETAVSRDRRGVRRLRLQPADPAATPAAVAAIGTADLIVLGPGSLFTSVLPPLLVPGIRDAVLAAPARRVYVANLLQEPAETIGYDAATHVERLRRHVDPAVVDTVVVPNVRRVRAPGLIPVDFDPGAIAAQGVEVALARLLDGSGFHHDPDRLARVLVRLARRPAPTR